ncbi:MAG: TolC family protein [Candidatus Hydrogenedentes bacterium]|nr:TolC family protein [Candidatus Hydrogenedentota bacterium]
MMFDLNRRSRRIAGLVIACMLPALAGHAQTDAKSTEKKRLADPAGPLSLADAVALALERNPGLAAFSWDVRAAESRQIQARLRPNPELTIEAEDIRLGRGPAAQTSLRTIGWSAGGLSAQAERESESGARSGLAEAQFTISLSQIIELGGKRAKRMHLAARDRDVAAWDYEVARADVLKKAAQAFVEVLVAQQRVALDDELVQLAEQVLQTVSARVDAGRVSPLEATKAETALSVARVQASRTKRQADSSRAGLAALWGAKEACFERAEGDLDTARGIPALDELVQRITKNPDLARWHAELERRQSAISVERATAVPDLTISAGFRASGTPDSDTRSVGFGSDGLSRSTGSSRSDSNWDNSVVLGLSVPLPLFNRNQGSIEEAEQRMAKAGEERRATDVQLHADLTRACHNLSAALAAITSLKENILPAATQTFASINEAYRRGKFGYLDVLDAQRTLFEARHQYLDALASYHESLAEIERVLGESLWNEREATSSKIEEQ